MGIEYDAFLVLMLLTKASLEGVAPALISRKAKLSANLVKISVKTVAAISIVAALKFNIMWFEKYD